MVDMGGLQRSPPKLLSLAGLNHRIQVVGEIGLRRLLSFHLEDIVIAASTKADSSSQFSPSVRRGTRLSFNAKSQPMVSVNDCVAVPDFPVTVIMTA